MDAVLKIVTSIHSSHSRVCAVSVSATNATFLLQVQACIFLHLGYVEDPLYFLILKTPQMKYQNHQFVLQETYVLFSQIETISLSFNEICETWVKRRQGCNTTAPLQPVFTPQFKTADFRV